MTDRVIIAILERVVQLLGEASPRDKRTAGQIIEAYRGAERRDPSLLTEWGVEDFAQIRTECVDDACRWLARWASRSERIHV